MVFDRPTLEEIRTRTQAELEAELSVGPLPRRSALLALSNALAAQSHLLHGHLSWVSRQILPTTAEGTQLNRHATLYGIVRKAATRATGSVTLTGTAGATMPIGSLMQNQAGVLYRATSFAQIAQGETTASVSVESVLAGSAGNIGAGLAIELTEPVPGIAAQATSGGLGIAGGADQEDDEDLRARILVRLQTPPQGGAAADYKAWALEVPGVTRAWPLPLYNGPGTVALTFATDDDPNGPIPSAAKVLEVYEYIEARRPVTVNEFTVFAPVEVDLDVTVQIVPDTPELRDAVIASLEDALLRKFSPGATLHLSEISEAISSAPGETYHVLAAPSADVSTELDELLVLGTVTFQEP